MLPGSFPFSSYKDTLLILFFLFFGFLLNCVMNVCIETFPCKSKISIFVRAVFLYLETIHFM